MRTKNNLVFLPRLATLLAVTLLAAGCNGGVPVSPVSAASPASTAASGSSPPPASVAQVNAPPSTPASTPAPAPAPTPAPAPAPATSPPAATSGSAKLSWVAPTQNTDGSSITGLSGYHIYYGTNADAQRTTITVAGGSSTTYTVSGLSPGTYYFSVVAYNAEGVDSADSNLESKTI
jgi:Fibronectin type III domain